MLVTGEGLGVVKHRGYQVDRCLTVGEESDLFRSGSIA